uniref:Nucleotid_trans domain-containing protein n=1 Tax=Panagrellus redivivus TaxID=6233 RepID=A0A7E4V0K6_PANRE
MQTPLVEFDNGYTLKHTSKVLDIRSWCLNCLKRVKSFTFNRTTVVILILTYLWICLLTYNLNRSDDNAISIDLRAKLAEVFKYTLETVENERIAIVLTVQKGSDYKDYEPGLNTIKCYAKHHGYQLHLLNLTDVPEWTVKCNQTDVFFKRHCAVVDFLERNIKTIDYMLYLDADMGVINPTHMIQEYFKEDGVEMTFYDRYYNHEIMAGSYLVKNTKYARDFIKFWADYFYRLPKSFHGTDNGCIHQVFMEQHFKSNATTAQKCYPLWAKSKIFNDLFRYQACTRHYLGMNTTLYCDGKVKLIRKGTWGYARDGWLTKTRWAPSDFIFHGWKVSKLGGEWQWPFVKETFNLDLCGPGTPN